MSKPIQQLFTFGDGQTHDASVSEISEAIELCQDYGWIIEPVTAGLTSGDADYTIEVSSNGVTWYNWKASAVGISVVDAFEDTHFPPTMIRINYNSNTETTGTVQFYLTLKQSA